MTATVRRWLDARAAGVPAGLMERIHAAATECFGDDRVSSGGAVRAGDETDKEATDLQLRAFFDVVREQVDQLRNRSCEERKDALDLLAADALLTYALEFVATVRPDALQKYAVELMQMVGGA